MSLAEGTRLGPYEVVARLGAGGMAEVYRARDTRIGREVAVKILHPVSALDPRARARLEREAQAAASVSHVNIVTLFDVGFEGETPYLVTEWIDGETLRALLRRGTLARERALAIGAQVARGLAAAHERGVVHRDLKPENLLIARDGTAKILDFGLARLAAAVVDANSPTLAEEQLTRAGDLLGTPAYMAPEQVRGLPVDHRTDLFALGVVLFEMILGRHPFPGDDAPAILSSILHHDPPELSASGSLPRPLRTLLRRCLARDPDERIDSAARLAAELEALARPATAESAEDAGDSQVRSLAVLPFVNLTGEPGGAFLCDGIAEQVLNALAQLPGLKVLARATCFRFRDRADEPIEVARELGVRAIVTGRVYQVAGRLVVRAELSDATLDRQLWGEQYDRESDDLLAVQTEIGREVADKLRLRLNPRQQAKLAARQTESPRAYELFLRARFLIEKRNTTELRHAIQLLREAVSEDPDYARAWSALADAWLLLERYGAEPPANAMPRAKEAARRAIDLASEDADAHVSLGQVVWYYDWDFVAGERDLRRAIELEPNHARAHHWLAFDLGEVGRHEEAAAEIGRALALDPLSLIIHTNAGTLAYWARDFDGAIRRIDRALELESGFAAAHQWRGRAHEMLGNHDAAIADFRAAREHLPDDPETLASLGHALARAGQRDAARELLAELEQLAGQRFVSAYWRGLLLEGLGEPDAALDALERAVAERFDWVIALGVEPAFDGLRQERRFADLVARVLRPPTSP